MKHELFRFSGDRLGRILEDRKGLCGFVFRFLFLAALRAGLECQRKSQE